MPLLLYVLLRGLDATVLKGLQQFGADHPVRGMDPISFCNLFFLAQLAVGLAALWPGRTTLTADLAALVPSDRRLLAVDAFLGLFLGPVAYYLALESLSVISQTLLFALVLPVSALLARGWLGEALPRSFWISLVLISVGLLLPSVSMAAAGGGMDGTAGLAWALVGVLAYGAASVSGRLVARRRLPLGVSVGATNLVSALVFGVIALVLFGPHHFLLLQLWWVVGVIGLYALTLPLGRELALRLAYRHLPVAQVSLWSSLSLVVALLSAAVLLGEPLQEASLAGSALVLAGVLASRWRWPIRSGPTSVLLPAAPAPVPPWP
ncbi:DMT family transporter [Synechococcus sp. CCAP 1479/9]|uniref:DMT family transporter n=1 Tax=Synechococcus sp. CCAP 1479/9 TaxID=1221593 RepID=UPI001C23267E